MTKNAAVTLRLSASLKRRLEARAESEHRSLSAQVVADLERVLEQEEAVSSGEGRFLGLFEGTALPTEQDIEEARRLLWGRLRLHG